MEERFRMALECPRCHAHLQVEAGTRRAAYAVCSLCMHQFQVKEGISQAKGIHGLREIAQKTIGYFRGYDCGTEHERDGGGHDVRSIAPLPCCCEIAASPARWRPSCSSAAQSSIYPGSAVEQSG